jgi:DNA helicase-2/ATP-dependent DNA helicase PcrA
MPGPKLLGRGVVVDAGAAVPDAWSGAPVVTIDERVLVEPEAVVTALHDAWSERRPVVVALEVDAARFRDPVAYDVPEPWRLDPGLQLWHDRLHFLVWANTYDARGGDPVWWWGRKAIKLGARPVEPSDRPAAGDVVLPGGTVAWVDGGPRGGLGPDDVGEPLVHAESVEQGLLTLVPPRPDPVEASGSSVADPAASVAGSAVDLAGGGEPRRTGTGGVDEVPDAGVGAGAAPAGDVGGAGDDRWAGYDEPPGWMDEPADWGEPLGAAAPRARGAAGGSGRGAPAGKLLAAVDLAADQRAAVEHGAGPARVIAPAGSGKTRVLTARLRHLVVERGYEPAAVVAVAYNRKAREEMVSRSPGIGARVLTLNALGYDLVAAGLGRRPNVIDQREVRRLLEPLVPRVARRLNTDPLAPYIDALGAVRLGLRDPAEVEDERGDVPGLAEAFPAYRDQLRRRGVIDFDEQVLLAIELLLADGPFRRSQQTRHRHLLVDEFQDLTPAHVLLVRLLAAPRFDVFGVGDDDQVIYGHAGASPRFLTEFDRYFPGADAHALEVNYRCPVPVVAAARNLLTRNRVRVPKQIRAAGEPDADGAVTAAAGEAVSPVTGPDAPGLRIVRHDPQAGASALAEVVRAWLDEPGTRPVDVAVLARVGSLLLAPQVALVDAGVPVSSSLRPDVLTRTGLRAALAYLRIAASPEDFAGADLVEVRRRPSRGLPTWVDKWLGRCRSIDDVVVAAGRIDDPKVADKLDGLARDLVELTHRARGGTTRAVLEHVRDGVGLGQAIDLLDASGGGDGLSHRDDLEGLIQVADLHPDPGGFEPWLRDLLARPGDDGGVTLSTVHRVKGREWPRVAVFGATDGLVPHRLSEGRAGIEEERRVFHVAITRGIGQVVVLADASRPSPFLVELEAPATAQELAAADTAVGAGRDGGRAGGGKGDELAARRARRRERLGGVAGSGGTIAEVDAAPVDPALVEALRGWRRDRSKADGVPAYVILHDRHLTTIAERHPTSLEALARCPGIGPARLEAYGEELVELLRAHSSAEG